ncbi:hypothetical protein [Geminocystis sp. NIES-3708]|uniref:hypothetical protein n=1 Tax=Geminocystis sp. NIES-3708 TaxID=1615909 RepID=UPI001187718A|nr:hypothetical protein [Geminocystis sp. NIES-3708]
MMQIRHFDVVGFSGSRSCSPAILYQVLELVKHKQIYVGCARGVDATVRSYSPPNLRVFKASDYGTGKSSFARRSMVMVNELKASGGCLISFPSSPCPSGLKPSPNPFNGKGSGSWATLAYAIFLNVPCFIYLDSFPVPHGWGFSPSVTDWFVVSPVKQYTMI